MTSIMHNYSELPYIHYEKTTYRIDLKIKMFDMGFNISNIKLKILIQADSVHNFENFIFTYQFISQIFTYK